MPVPLRVASAAVAVVVAAAAVDVPLPCDRDGGERPRLHRILRDFRASDLRRPFPEMMRN